MDNIDLDHFAAQKECVPKSLQVYDFTNVLLQESSCVACKLLLLLTLSFEEDDHSKTVSDLFDVPLKGMPNLQVFALCNAKAPRNGCAVLTPDDVLILTFSPPKRIFTTQDHRPRHVQRSRDPKLCQ